MTAIRPPGRAPRPTGRDYLLNLGFPLVLLVVVVVALYGPARRAADDLEACSHNPGELARPTAMAVGPSGALVVLQQSAGCLTSFHGDEFKLLADGLDRQTEAMTIARDGTVYVGDTGRVPRLTDDGDAEEIADLRSEIRGLAVDDAGNIYAATFFRVTRIAKGGRTTTVLGEGRDNPVTGGSARATRVSPESIALDGAGNVYVTEYFTRQILKAGPDDKLAIVAGTGQVGFEGDGGPATAAKLTHPLGLVASPDGTLYFADVSNYRIRKVDPSGIITTVAGNGAVDTYSDNLAGPALDVPMTPRILALAGDTLYFTNPYTDWIRRLDLPTATVTPY